MGKTICALAMLSLLAGPAALAQASRDEASAELEAVRGRIDALRGEIEREGRQRTRAERALAEVEQSEQKARRELAGVREQLNKTRRRQRELERQADQERAKLEEQRRILGKQLRVAYINGDEEWLRVALNQQDASGFGRRMTYYGYLSRQRSSAIDVLRKTIVKLELTRLEIQEKARELARLESSAAEKLEAIAETRSERAALLSKISSSIKSKDAEISKLQAQAAELTELVASLARMLPEMPAIDAGPFAGRTASLSWPADGPVLKNFGQSRADGSLKWTGMLLGAPAGSEVRAVYHGRVIFSDWLDGMGLLTIIEHGDGYMSLYGHNQDLLKEVGEWVSPGEPIGHVGDSGGQAAAGLYFEIRKDGEPVNPRSWIK
ncbi:MAG: peptidoglycan DD-metalloendopeptidase family protein [Gammaproteobacteria bacterium]|jgi:septal ring factor EnvC (AmiA/AmiB activator)|nr:peptidoglycan DD-metalloendopeptidase family protein [Gammaproteobacteria bacterium]MDP6616860.1 peptidoglycan DD-metalloendopeptidase family protein [Gammaproteobacteria bacterium]MDP6694580.1 peptidoglycan DD-metalloendopeptidase family protein [Gammaproteobacteria bacterium]